MQLPRRCNGRTSGAGDVVLRGAGRGGAAAVRCGGGLTAAHLAAHVSICRGEGGEGH